MRLILYVIATWIGVEVLALAALFAIASWEGRHSHVARAVLLSEWRERSTSGLALHGHTRRKSA